MGLSAFRRNRRSIASLALAGVALYVAFVPFHLASRFVATLANAELSDALQVICHSGGAVSSGEAPQLPGDDGSSTVNCPVCQALGGLQMAVLAAVLLGFVSEPAQRVTIASDDPVPPGHTAEPRSRGPPIAS